MLYDLGWILFDLAYSLTMLQLVAFAVCFLDDHRAIPIMPKWVSWFCAWVAFTFLVLAILPFFKAGPYSRSGICTYWVEKIGRAPCRDRVWRVVSISVCAVA